MVKFIDLDITQLYKIIRAYKLETQIIPPKKKISQLSKAELVAEIEKHLELKDDKIYFKSKTGNFEIPKASKPRPVNPNAPERPKKATKTEIIEQLKQRIDKLEKIIDDFTTGKSRKEFTSDEIMKENLYNERDRIDDLLKSKLKQLFEKYTPKIAKANSEGNYELKNTLEKQYRLEVDDISQILGKDRKEIVDKLQSVIKKQKEGIIEPTPAQVPTPRPMPKAKKEKKLKPVEFIKQEPKIEKFIPEIGFETVRKDVYKEAKNTNAKQYIELLKDKPLMKELKKIYESGDMLQILQGALRVFKTTTDPDKKMELNKRIGLMNTFLTIHNMLSKNKDIVVDF